MIDYKHVIHAASNTSVELKLQEWHYVNIKAESN